MPTRKPRPRKVRPWWVLLLALAYVLLPFDFIPEALLPVIGWLDDAGVLGIAIGWWIRKRRRGHLGAGQRRDDSPSADDSHRP